MRAAKRDSNHAKIRDGLRKIIGHDAVVDAGGWKPHAGFDLMIRWMDGPIHVLEIKRDSSAELTPSEEAAQKRYGPYWHRVETLQQAFDAIGLDLEVAPF